MKDKFIEIFTKNVTRNGGYKLLDWLLGTDFFTAPASTKYHLAEEGGLCKHSVHVYERLKKLYSDEFCNGGELSAEQLETVTIVGLLHDLCKVGFYEVEMRNKKIDGKWEQVPTYVCNDKFPFGHGEKSVYLAKLYIELSAEEAMAIRWHMGFSDNDFKAGGYGVSNAFEKYKLCVMTHIADLEATYLDE